MVMILLYLLLCAKIEKMLSTLWQNGMWIIAQVGTDMLDVSMRRPMVYQCFQLHIWCQFRVNKTIVYRYKYANRVDLHL